MSTLSMTIKNNYYDLKQKTYNNSDKILTVVNVVGAVGAVGMSIYITAKKMPKIKERYNQALKDLDNSILTNVEESQKTLDDLGQNTIDRIFHEDSQNDPDNQEEREFVENLNVVIQNGTEIYAHERLKLNLKYAGLYTLAYLPVILLLGGSVVASIMNYKINVGKLMAAGLAISGLTAELAETREELRNKLGEKKFKQADIKALQENKEIEDEDELKKRLYCRLYSDHLLSGLDLESSLRTAEAQLLNTERLANRKFMRSRDGKLYFGDVLRALDFDTDECAQNCGWAIRHGDDIKDYDGYIDFGCWTIDPETGHKKLNPNNISEEGEILLDFNVEGKISDLYTFRK